MAGYTAKNLCVNKSFKRNSTISTGISEFSNAM